MEFIENFEANIEYIMKRMDLLTIFEANIEYIMKRMEIIEKFWSKYWIYNEKNGVYWQFLKQISNI